MLEWLEISIRTSEQNHEDVEGLILSHGIQGLIEHDPKEFFLFLNNPNREWDYIEDELVDKKESKEMGFTFYVSNTSHGNEQFENIRHDILKNIGSLDIDKKIVKDSDWENNWKQYYKPIEIGEKIVIKPSWEIYENKDSRAVVELDPGQIFGTGTHETTQLVITELEKYTENGMKILDLGCGSGILAISALKLGADSAICVDIDKNAIAIVGENAEINDVSDKIKIYTGNIISDETLRVEIDNKYDIIVANIVADVIIAITGYAYDALKENGVFITSGIIKERAKDVEAELKKIGFTDLRLNSKGEWVSITAKKQLVSG